MSPHVKLVYRINIYFLDKAGPGKRQAPGIWMVRTARNRFRRCGAAPLLSFDRGCPGVWKGGRGRSGGCMCLILACIHNKAVQYCPGRTRAPPGRDAARARGVMDGDGTGNPRNVLYDG
jgi:hypothetical protein